MAFVPARSIEPIANNPSSPRPVRLRSNPLRKGGSVAGDVQSQSF